MSTRSLPAHAVISGQLRRDIALGKYDQGRRLPTEAELAVHYKVSRQTVRRAFHDLVSESIVLRVPGRGTFVNDNLRGRYFRSFSSVDDLLTLSRDTEVEILQPLQPGVDIYAATRLELPTDLVYSLVLRRLHNRLPFVETTVYLADNAAALIADRAELSRGGVGTYTIIGLLEPLLASPIVRAEQSITVAPAEPSTSRSLGCDTGHSMLRIDRLYTDKGGRPVELAVSYFLPDHYTYRVTLQRSETGSSHVS